MIEHKSTQLTVEASVPNHSFTNWGEYDMSGSSKAKLERDKFDTTALTHIDSVYRFALYMVQDDEKAQNLVLYTYLKAYMSPYRFKDRTSSRIWLLAILNDAITKTNHNLTEAEGRDSQDNSDVTEKRLSGIRFGEITTAISKLPVLDRAIILLSDMERLSCEEIANIVGCPIESVSSRLFRARKLLIGKLKDTINGRDQLAERSKKAKLAIH